MARDNWVYQSGIEVPWAQRVVAVVILAACIFAAVMLGGCGAASTLPSASQISLNLPSNVRNCPVLPKSPGATATSRQTAVYIVRLHSVAKRCGANMKVVDRLYTPYRAKVEKIAKGG